MVRRQYSHRECNLQDVYHFVIFPIVVPPRIELQIQMKKMQPVKAGRDVRLEAEIFGKPMPKVTWSKDGQVLKGDLNLKLTQKRNLFGLEMNSVTKKQTGVFTILAENASGSKTEEITVKVLGE